MFTIEAQQLIRRFVKRHMDMAYPVVRVYLWLPVANFSFLLCALGGSVVNMALLIYAWLSA